MYPPPCSHFPVEFLISFICDREKPSWHNPGGHFNPFISVWGLIAKWTTHCSHPRVPLHLCRSLLIFLSFVDLSLSAALSQSRPPTVPASLHHTWHVSSTSLCVSFVLSSIWWSTPWGRHFTVITNYSVCLFLCWLNVTFHLAKEWLNFLSCDWRSAEAAQCNGKRHIKI